MSLTKHVKNNLWDSHIFVNVGNYHWWPFQNPQWRIEITGERWNPSTWISMCLILTRWTLGPSPRRARSFLVHDFKGAHRGPHEKYAIAKKTKKRTGRQCAWWKRGDMNNEWSTEKSAEKKHEVAVDKIFSTTTWKNIHSILFRKNGILITPVFIRKRSIIYVENTILRILQCLE